MESHKQFLIDYFKICLKNDNLTDYTLIWINNNHERLSSENSWHIWFDYLIHFSEKHNLRKWHDVMSYSKLYEIYIDVGFSAESASLHAKRVQKLMKDDDNCMGWRHDPNIFYWLPRLLPKGRNDNYNINDYY